MDKREDKSFTRRDLLRYTALAGAGVLLTPVLSSCGGAGKDKFPEKAIECILPTSEGGGLDFIARAHGKVWAESMGTTMSFSFYPGASGEVGYTLFSKRPADGYTVLMGNLGPNTVMYTLQGSSFKFDDIIFFSTLSVDPLVFLVRKNSPFQDMKQLISEGKKRRLKMGVGHWASNDAIGGLVLKQQTGADINIVPYGGGNKARVGLLNGELDFMVTPLAAMQSVIDTVRVLAIAQNVNEYPDLSQNCPTVNQALGINMPEIASYRNWALPKALKEKYPQRYKLLVRKAEESFNDNRVKEGLKAFGQPLPMYNKYRGEEWTMAIAQECLKMARTFKDDLKGMAPKK